MIKKIQTEGQTKDLRNKLLDIYNLDNHQKIIKNIVVATTTKKNDAVICNICKKRKIDFLLHSCQLVTILKPLPFNSVKFIKYLCF